MRFNQHTVIACSLLLDYLRHTKCRCAFTLTFPLFMFAFAQCARTALFVARFVFGESHCFAVATFTHTESLRLFHFHKIRFAAVPLRRYEWNMERDG